MGLGFVLFVYIAVLNVVVLNFLPLEWLSEHKLFDLSRAGLLASVVIGYLLTTLVMYAWHRATHKFDALWRIFHQLHHSPRHLNVYVAGINHPLDLSIYIALPFLIGLYVLGVSPLEACALYSLVDCKQ